MPCRLLGGQKCCEVFVGSEGVVFRSGGDEAGKAELFQS